MRSQVWIKSQGLGEPRGLDKESVTIKSPGSRRMRSGECHSTRHHRVPENEEEEISKVTRVDIVRLKSRGLGGRGR